MKLQWTGYTLWQYSGMVTSIRTFRTTFWLKLETSEWMCSNRRERRTYGRFYIRFAAVTIVKARIIVAVTAIVCPEQQTLTTADKRQNGPPGRYRSCGENRKPCLFWKSNPGHKVHNQPLYWPSRLDNSCWKEMISVLQQRLWLANCLHSDRSLFIIFFSL